MCLAGAGSGRAAYVDWCETVGRNMAWILWVLLGVVIGAVLTLAVIGVIGSAIVEERGD